MGKWCGWRKRGRGKQGGEVSGGEKQGGVGESS